MSWKVEELGEVCQIINGRNQKYVISENGSYPIFGSGGNVMGYATKFLCEENTVIIGRKGNISNPILIKQKFWNVDTAFGIYPFIEKMLPLFNYYQCLNIDFASYNKGTTIPSLVKSDLLKIQISYPKSLSEQQAIVEKLDAAFALIDQAKANIEKNIQNAKELFQSKLNQIFSQKGEGWEERKLGEIGKVCMCKRIMKHQTDPDGEIPFYKIGTFGKAADAFISNEIYLDFKKKYSYPKKGEILISASGTIGRRVIFDGEAAYFQDSNIVWIQNDESKVLNNYLYHFYSVCDWNPSKGATISRLYNDDLRKISISFPTIDKQNDLIPIIEKLSQQTNLLQEKYRQKLQNLEELRKSILEKAFKGELVQMSESQISTD